MRSPQPYLKVVHNMKTTKELETHTLLNIYKELIKLDQQIAQLRESTCITSKNQ